MNKFNFLIVLLLIIATSCSKSSTEKVLRFSAIPDDNKVELKKRFTKVAAYLESKLQVKVEFVPVAKYAAAVSLFKNNEIQLAWFGGYTGVQARRAVSGSQAIAQGQEDFQFMSYFIANTSTGITASKEFPQAIAGKTFSFGSPASTSGRLMPEFYVTKYLGKSPQQAFKKVLYSGSHDKTIESVLSGTVEVGALNYATFDKWRAARLAAGDQQSIDKVKVIWRTPTSPEYNWTARGDVDKNFGAGFTARLQQALLDLNDKDLLAEFVRTRFIKADNSLYESIEKTAIEAGLLNN